MVKKILPFLTSQLFKSFFRCLLVVLTKQPLSRQYSQDNAITNHSEQMCVTKRITKSYIYIHAHTRFWSGFAGLRNEVVTNFYWSFLALKFARSSSMKASPEV